MLNTRADGLVKLLISCAIHLRATREKMAPRFASVTSEEIIQINVFVVYIISLFSEYILKQLFTEVEVDIYLAPSFVIFTGKVRHVSVSHNAGGFLWTSNLYRLYVLIKQVKLLTEKRTSKASFFKSNAKEMKA